MKRATWAAFVVGLALGMGCGAAKVLPGPTTILVKVHLIASQGIDQLYVTGTVNGFDEFPRTYLPEDAGAPFNGPQSFRVFLADSEDGKNVEIDVFGVTQGNPVAAGTATVTVLKQHEVEADIDLSPSVTDSGPGGGMGGGSGTGGGVAMGGGAGGGGGATTGCGCDGGCCDQGANTCAVPRQIPLSRIPSGSITVTDCGAPEMTCMAACDPVKGFCNSGKCSCGPNLVCRDGERCVVTGTGGSATFACKCDEASGCQGCCNNGTCIPLSAEDGGHCGAAGSQCEQCNSGTANGGCTGGTCGAQMCQPDECGSGNRCNNVQFPTCVGVLNNRCTACDPLRSNHCSVVYGAQSQGCACGINKQCDPGQYCDNSFNCQKLF